MKIETVQQLNEIVTQLIETGNLKQKLIGGLLYNLVEIECDNPEEARQLKSQIKPPVELTGIKTVYNNDLTITKTLVEYLHIDFIQK